MVKKQFTREEVSSLIEQGHVVAHNVEDTLNVTGITADVRAWHQFIDKMLLWLGVLALALALMFIVAFNWDALGRFAQFILVEVAIVIAFIFYYRSDKESLLSTASLVLASLFVGVLLALYGQTYQTGADAWQLFFSWALLILPWTLLARLPALWIFWIVLLNMAMVLYFQVSGTFLGMDFHTNDSVHWALFFFNVIVQIVWELVDYKTQKKNTGNWYIRLLTFASGTQITLLMLSVIFDHKGNPLLTFCVWALYLFALYVMYRRIKPDLFVLAGGCFSAIVVIISFLAKQFNEDFIGLSFLLLTFAIIGLGTASAYWLKSVSKEVKA